MRDTDYRQWIGTAIGVIFGSVVVVVNYLQGDVVFAAIFLALLGLLVWWWWPSRRGSHISHAAARAEAADGDVVVYWRPG